MTSRTRPPRSSDTTWSGHEVKPKKSMTARRSFPTTLVLLCVLVAGFCSGTEVALFSLRRVDREQLTRSEARRDRMIVALLCGATLFAANPALAFKWYKVAAEKGDVDAGKKRDDVAARLDGKALTAAKNKATQTAKSLGIELGRVPYLRRYSLEREIYDSQLSRATVGKHIAPHTLEVAAMFAVLSRLEQPKGQLTTFLTAPPPPPPPARLRAHAPPPP